MKAWIYMDSKKDAGEQDYRGLHNITKHSTGREKKKNEKENHPEITRNSEICTD